MTAQRTLDVSRLPSSRVSSEAPLWWGQVFLAIIEGVLLLTLIAMYFYFRLSMDVWPPPGARLGSRTLATLCLAVLFASCIGSYIASEGAKKNERGRMIFGLLVNLALAGVAMGIRAVEWGSWNFKWTTTAYGSVVWAMIFVHTIDVAADLVFTAVLVIILVLGRYGPRQSLGVHVDSIIWYFLVAIWIPLYATIYWGPVWVGVPR